MKTTPLDVCHSIEEVVMRYQHNGVSAERAMSEIAAIIADEESPESEPQNHEVVALLDAFPYEVRIAYYRISDDSVSSGVWQPGDRRTRYVRELIESDDISHAWWRRLGAAGDEVHTFKGESQ